MSADAETDPKFEIGHVLFIDIVGYSRLLIGEQSETVRQLKEIVTTTEQFRRAEAQDKLLTLPTGDGMALVFRESAEAPAQCALEIAEALKKHPRLRVRMGIHSGPVDVVTDVNNRANVTGAGINVAQRIMDCGDGGHILVSKRVADDLAEYRRWQPYLHGLGDFEVKHGVVVSVFNLYTDAVGNADPPSKLKRPRNLPDGARQSEHANRSPISAGLLIGGLMLFSVVVVGLIFGPAILKQASKLETATPVWTASATPSAAAIPQKSIAVLPFANLSANQENAFFTDGIQDEILTNLARIADLKVISRTSVMQYKSGSTRNLRQIGKELGVVHLLEGSVQRAGTRVRVNAQLIDALTDTHLWAQTYDRDLADVFAIQSEIAKTIADQLQAKLSPREKVDIERPPTTDLAAFDFYNRAKAAIATSAFGVRFREDLPQAVRLLDAAVARDPTFTAAYCELAGVHDYIYFYGMDHTPERLALADAAVDKALQLDPESGEAHLTRAQHLYRGYFDYNGARAELAIARQTLPNDPRVFELIGYIDRRQGRQKEGLANLERARALDPRNFGTLQQIALSYGAFRRYAEMAVMLDRALAIVPPDVATDTKVARAQVSLDWRADTRPLHAVLEAVLAKDPAAAQDAADNWLYLALCERDAVAAGRALDALGSNTFGPDAILFSRKFGEGLVARMRGDSAAARTAFTAARAQQEETIRSQGEYPPTLCVLGLIDAALGRKENAIREGKRAVELLPMEQDALNGLRVREFLAMIYAWTGEKELACQQLASTIQLPASVSYGELRLHPYWDPLRGEPCFEKIVASLAPKN